MTPETDSEVMYCGECGHVIGDGSDSPDARRQVAYDALKWRIADFVRQWGLSPILRLLADLGA